jgi:hypothetical protein
LTKDYQILFAVLGLWELPLGRGSLGARIFWPPRRKFDPDEADCSDQSDRSSRRSSTSRQGSFLFVICIEGSEWRTLSQPERQ